MRKLPSGTALSMLEMHGIDESKFPDGVYHAKYHHVRTAVAMRYQRGTTEMVARQTAKNSAIRNSDT